MRVALISPLYESVPPKLYGGTERVIHGLCRGLIESDVEVTVFASGDSAVDGKLIPVIDEAFRLRKSPIADPNPYHLKMLEMVASRADEFDVIHNHHDYWMLPLSEMTNTPLLTTVHGRLDLPDIAEAFYAYPNANFISITDAQRAPMKRLRWLRTIHHGIDPDTFKFHEKPGKYLAFLGRMDAAKRPDLAIQIAKESGVPLKIAAKIEGPEMSLYYDTFVKPHVDGKFIEYVGEICESEKSEFLGNAFATVFPIDWPEPFGLVMIESLACGTPVLARPCGSVPELLEHGLTGYIDMDPRELAKRVQDIPKISRKKCRQWVEHRFSQERMTEDYIHVYRHLSEFASARRKEGRFDRRGRYQLHSVERIADGNS
jgi:glycosyltransferase involved in cell wall biosynthesis